MHRRQRDARAIAVGQAPHDLDVVAEVERVGAQGQVARHHDEAHDHDVGGGAGGDGRAHRQARHGDWRQREARRDDDGQDDDEIFRALQRDAAEPHAPDRKNGDRERRQDQRGAVERPREPRQVRRV